MEQVAIVHEIEFVRSKITQRDHIAQLKRRRVLHVFDFFMRHGNGRGRDIHAYYFVATFRPPDAVVPRATTEFQ